MQPINLTLKGFKQKLDHENKIVINTLKKIIIRTRYSNQIKISTSEKEDNTNVTVCLRCQFEIAF